MIDYGASGVTNRLEHRLVDSRTLEDIGVLEGVTSYTLTESWRGDYRQAGSIDVVGTALPLWAAVRTCLVSELSGEVERHDLATLVPDPSGREVEYGVEVASYDLKSPLVKLAGRLQERDRAVAAGTQVGAYFNWLCEACGAVGWVHPGIVDRRTGAVRVWEAGDSYLTEAHTVAGAVGGRVEPDAYGRVCLVPYQLPALVGQSFEVHAGESSTVLPGASYEQPDPVNQVVCSYSQDDVKYFSVAAVGPEHEWSYERTGRWFTVEIQPPAMSEGAGVQAALDAATAQALKAYTDTSATWSVQMAYMPVRVGQAGTILYVDSPGMDPVSIEGFVSQREIKQDGAFMKMELTIEEV